VLLERIDVRRRVLPKDDEPNHEVSSLERGVTAEISRAPVDLGNERPITLSHAHLRRTRSIRAAMLLLSRR
jgi:hypothetical protein